jgi:hypothetical protein
MDQVSGPTLEIGRQGTVTWHLYGIPTKALKQAVRRNIDRFPPDFMFVLNEVEFHTWRSQFVTSEMDRKGLRYAPMAFTELMTPPPTKGKPIGFRPKALKK